MTLMETHLLFLPQPLRCEDFYQFKPLTVFSGLQILVCRAVPAPFWPLSQHCSIVPAECRGLDYRETRAVLVCSVPELTRGLQLLVMISIRILSDWEDLFSLNIYPSVTALITLCFFSLLFYISMLSAALVALRRQ